MIKITNIQTCNWEAAIRGMRNPMESYDRMDSKFGASAKYFNESKDIIMVPEFVIGPNDLDLMKRLVNAGTDHSKFMRMITVSFDIVAPLYW